MARVEIPGCVGAVARPLIGGVVFWPGVARVAVTGWTEVVLVVLVGLLGVTVRPDGNADAEIVFSISPALREARIGVDSGSRVVVDGDVLVLAFGRFSRSCVRRTGDFTPLECVVDAFERRD